MERIDQGLKFELRACRVSFADKVVGSRDDRYGRGLRPERPNCNVADRDHRVGFEGCEISGQSRDTFDMPLGVAPHNENVVALDDPLVMESLRHSIAGISGGVGFEHANSRQLDLSLAGSQARNEQEQRNHADLAATPTHLLISFDGRLRRLVFIVNPFSRLERVPLE